MMIYGLYNMVFICILIKYNRNWSNRAEEEERCVANQILHRQKSRGRYKSRVKSHVVRACNLICLSFTE